MEELDGFEVQSFHTNGINSVRFIDPSTNLSCPVRGFKTSLGDIAVYYDPISFTYRECTCPLAYYWNIAMARCMICMEGFHCNHTMVHDASTAISIQSGYYPLCNGTLCDTINRWPLPTLLDCALTGICNPHGNTTQFTCADGYDVTSMMCSRCNHGWYSASGRCVTCPASPRATISILTTVAIVVLIIGISQYEFQLGASAAPALIMFWFQLCSILDGDIALRSKPNGDAIGAANGFTSLFGLQDVASLDMSMVSCTSHDDDMAHSQFERSLYLKMILFVVLYVLVLIIILVQRITRQCHSRATPLLEEQLIADMHDPSRRVASSGDQVMRVRSFIAPAARDDDEHKDEPLLAAMSELQHSGSRPCCCGCACGHTCRMLPSQLLMMAYFLMESLFLPLVTQLMQVCIGVPCVRPLCC